MDHLDKELISETCERIWSVQGSLKGLGGLCMRPGQSASFEDEDLYGLGQLLKKLAEDLGVIEDLIRSGQSEIGDEHSLQIKFKAKEKDL